MYASPIARPFPNQLAALLRPIGLILILLLALAPVAACSSETQAVLHTAKGDFPFTIEVAQTDQERERGLMYRQTLAPDAGMLFDFFTEQPVTFWMQNTLIPLDMVFIGADGVVKNVHANARPMDTTSIPSGAPVRFVLEIAGGRAAQIGLSAGDRFEHPQGRHPGQMNPLAAAGALAALLLAAVAVLQLALALGAPLGAYAWGGAHEGTLPQRLRVGSAITAPLLLAMAVIVLIDAGLLWPEWQREMFWAGWAICLFLVINTVGNWRSESPRERRVMAPLTGLIALLVLIVQFGGR